MATLRAFVEADIPHVAGLHGRTFDHAGHAVPAEQEYHEYFRDVFLTGPRPDSGFSSIVAEHDGVIVGFLGVVPISMCLGMHRIRACVCTQFCVDHDHRGLTGLQMIRHLFAGPQDLSITDEANEDTRKLWIWAGGETIMGSSLYWFRPLRPARVALSMLTRAPVLSAAAVAARPLAQMADALLARVPGSHFHQTAPRTADETLDTRAMVEGWPGFVQDRPLRPAYEPAPLEWYLRRAAARGHGGPLRRLLVRAADGTMAGWYLYYVQKGGTGEVLQVAARPGATRDVLDHLFFDAWRQGVTALSGRVDPREMQAYSDRYCLFTRRGPWMLAHARDGSRLVPLHRGDAFFSRLDGEWCARMH